MLGPPPPVRFCLLVNDPTLSESAKSRELRGNVGYVGVWIAWVKLICFFACVSFYLLDEVIY